MAGRNRTHIWGPVVLILVVAFLLFVVYEHRFGSAPGPRRLAVRRTNLRELTYALKTYSVDNEGAMPHSEEGPEAALYLLKDLVPAEQFNIPDRPTEGAPARYDDETRRVVNCGYLYLNGPTDPDEWTAMLCILVERWPDGERGVTAAFGDGRVEYLRLPADKQPADLLGRGHTAFPH